MHGDLTRPSCPRPPPAPALPASVSSEANLRQMLAQVETDQGHDVQTSKDVATNGH
jgi:hypothetical protein